MENHIHPHDPTEGHTSTLEGESCAFLQAHPDVVADVQKAMLSEEEQTALADLFRMFGDPTRLRILMALQASELCVCDIAQLLGMTVSAISHQLRLLKVAGLVNYRRVGKSIIYSLADDHVRIMMQNGIDHIRE